MNDAPVKKKFNVLKSLEKDDLIALYAFFDAEVVDYEALDTMIGERFGDRPILLKICRAFADAMEQIDAGEEIELEVQGMVAKTVLSMIVNSGRVDAARKFLAACVEKMGLETMLEIHTMLTAIDTDVRKISILDRTWLDYQVYDRGHPTTIVLMCGTSHRFGVELNAVALWLESLPVNVIYMRDFKLTLYLTGVRSLGKREAALARLREDLDAMGTRRTVVMGNSGGAYGALYYGHLLGADQVLCFAGPTSLEVGTFEASERPVYDRIERLSAERGFSIPDLRACYVENGIQVRYFYGLDYAFDVMQSKNLEGLPNVKLEGLDNFAKHVVIGEMARRNVLSGVFAEAAGI